MADCQHNGAGRVKDEAIKDLYRTHRLPPFTTAAVLLLPEEEMDSPAAPARGLITATGAPWASQGYRFTQKARISRTSTTA